MGPRSLDRGNILVEKQTALDGLSSMGPRSLDRGNAIMGGGSAMSQLDLQWGRDLSIAEIFTTSGTIASVSGSLQWGRDLSIAEIHLEPRKGGRGRLSSMGPRSLDRGNGEKACVFCR